MCNLYRVRATRDEIGRLFNANCSLGDEQEKDYVSPGRAGYVIRQVEGVRLMERMTWGFPPPDGVRSPVVNVRNYTSPFWRGALKNTRFRCLVPTTEFQEWTVEADPETGKKRPHWFKVPSRPVFSFAGVWRPTDRGGAYAFLTCGYDGDPCAHVVGAIHPKACPVILHDEDYDRWLEAPLEEALLLACTYPSQLMAMA
jgi:putative SOS response-associated peptidase YedK